MEARFDLLAIGEPMVEFNQAGGAASRSYLEGFGGDTSNAAIAASRQGARRAWTGVMRRATLTLSSRA